MKDPLIHAVGGLIDGQPQVEISIPSLEGRRISHYTLRQAQVVATRLLVAIEEAHTLEREQLLFQQRLGPEI